MADSATTLTRLLRGNTSAIKLYRANLANPQEFDGLRMWVRRELDSIQSGFASTDEVVKTLASLIQELFTQIQDVEAQKGEDGKDGQDGQDGDAGDLINDDLITNVLTWSSEKINHELSLKMNWVKPYTPGDFRLADDVVEDNGWLMIANKDTSDPAAPSVVGDPFYPYQGTLTDTSVSAKQVIMGSRYTIGDGGYIGAYRLYVQPNQEYDVYLVTDPLGVPVTSNIGSYSASSAGWITFPINPRFLLPGLVFDLVALVAEPDPAPVVVSANYDYQTPQNAGAPASGSIQHGRSTPGVMHIAYLDDDGTDRTTLLQNLVLGDAISGANTTWTVQSTQDQGAFMDIVVTPATAGSPAGVQQFDFATNAPQPIDYGFDTDYWLTSPFNVQGLHGVDTDYESIIPSDAAYGVDIFVQLALVSPDWDFMAYTDSTGGATGQQLSAREAAWVQGNAELFQSADLMTTDNTWTTMGVITVPVGNGYRARAVVTAKRADAFGYYHAEYYATTSNNAGILSQDTTVLHESSTNPALDVRLIISGSNAEFQVRGAAFQDWHWQAVVFDREIT